MIKPELMQELLKFRKERDWEQFHHPKDIAISLSIEAAELLEWFQWRRPEEVKTMLASDKREHLEDEIADVAVYLSYLCYDLDINLDKAVARKMQKNAVKYPKDQVRGSADKYTEY